MHNVFLVCPAGYKLENPTTCTKCVFPTYQPDANQVTCLPCPAAISQALSTTPTPVPAAYTAFTQTCRKFLNK